MWNPHSPSFKGFGSKILFSGSDHALGNHYIKISLFSLLKVKSIISGQNFKGSLLPLL
jgi:hypothetical protein